ncbi:MAG: hypothetical protein V7K55_05140 [Nostoc sp.]|uniref:hypothetical protein n=1 Tax=Nostoc sp. TaxID=1180 RepID=UPI002FFA96C9
MALASPFGKRGNAKGDATCTPTGSALPSSRGTRKGGVPHLLAWFSLMALTVKTLSILPEKSPAHNPHPMSTLMVGSAIR